MFKFRMGFFSFVIFDFICKIFKFILKCEEVKIYIKFWYVFYLGINDGLIV